MTRWEFPYPSQRMPVLAGNVVATSQPLAAQAGMDILRRGGNAVDAAIATAVTLTVVEPTSNGLGSDAFAMIHHNGRLFGINGSGRSPQAWTYEQFAHLSAMPQLGWQSVTVPGAVSVWAALSERFGSVAFEQLFRYAIDYAEHGFAVSPITALAWQKAAERYGDFAEFKRVFLPQGKPPAAGQCFFNTDLAASLRKIAMSGGQAFYHGDIAENIVQTAQSEGAPWTILDMQQHQADWVQPLSVDYYGYTVHELPPNGQGLAVLVAAALLHRLDIARYPLDSVDSLHLQIEAMKIGLHAAATYLADPDCMHVPAQALLKQNIIERHAALIDLQAAQSLPYELATDHGTVYLSTADASGTMVSMIQSNYMGFGSGVVVPDTGIALQNRGCGFSLVQGHANQVDGGKRPFHTIIPGFVTKDGHPVLSFGVMGGRMQAQGHLQMIVRILNGKQNPQAASDAPRWHVAEDGSVDVESTLPVDVVTGLEQRGHKINIESNQATFGGAQLILKQDRTYIGASDHRKDGLAAGF
jgi:gamma-glutamyltranspeptidase/glutathione hydrolase